MACAKRSEVFDPDTVGDYHCFNRIVRRSYLCGFDPHTGKDYSHRREWFYQRLKYLAQFFAIDVTRILDESAVLACLAYVDLNPLRAHLTDRLEAYRHVSIGERLRSLENEAIDSSSWLAPIAQTNETDGQPVTVVNDLSRQIRSDPFRKSGRILTCSDTCDACDPGA